VRSLGACSHPTGHLRTLTVGVLAVARRVLGDPIMLASRPVSPSLKLVSRMSYGLPRALEAALGGMLELVVHTIEGLRDHGARVAMLRARRDVATM
jgi:hypothetical protein